MTAAAGKSTDAAIGVRRLLAVGILAFVFFLVARFPAGVAWHIATPFLNDVRLSGVEGTLWNGRADALNIAGMELGSLRWRLRPSGLLWGEWRNAVHIEGSGFDLEGDMGIGVSGAWSGSDLAFRGELDALIARFFPASMRPPMALDAALTGRLEEIVVTDSGLEALEGRVSATSVEIDGSDAPDLNVTLVSRDGGLEARIDPGDGNTPGLEGRVVLMPAGDYRLDLDIADPALAGERIGELVRALGSQGGDGRWRINWEGRL